MKEQRFSTICGKSNNSVRDTTRSGHSRLCLEVIILRGETTTESPWDGLPEHLQTGSHSLRLSRLIKGVEEDLIRFIMGCLEKNQVKK